MAEAARFAGAHPGATRQDQPPSEAEKHWREPIAIIGMDARLPGSPTLADYWDNLAACSDCVGPVPEGLHSDRAARRQPGIAEGGFIEDVDAFDAAFFGISPDEARLMDPLQRIALESAWHCIEDAGYRATDLARGRTGVFLATGKSDYEELLYRSDIAPDKELATGVASAVMANRISFALGLTGPSLAIDSACSGSLAALHIAAQAIRAGDCTSAIVGAANLILAPTLSRSLKAEGALSPDCRTRSFDAAGNGYARGEGVVTLLLKTYAQALADGDNIYGLLIGSAISHGGRANWLTAPNPTAQKQLIATTWQRAGIDPRTVTYIEAHGTGTPLGDPIEFNAIRMAYEELAGRGESIAHRCGVGSAKASIGHLEAASGLAGVVKVLLAMKHACLPGSPQLRTVNPMCKTQGTPFHFVQSTEPWERLHDHDRTPLPFRAGVSAFGFGGACGHVVIEESPPRQQGASAVDVAPVLPILPISARDAETLKRMASRLRLHIERAQDRGAANARPDLEDFLYTFQIGRTPLPTRVAILARDWHGLAASLANFVAGRDDPDVIARPETAAPAVRDEMEELSFRFAREWVSAAKVDFAGLYGVGQRRRVSAPGYCFARTRFWFTDPKTSEMRLQAAGS
ncbi:hypothetical protein LB524_23635 [Mesorhizobium sp. ESP6-5]|uniref:beta-ketoacyl synthase N-terminal-like domain-containing protein n=1 Tax=Mesorhizobium sp. ESP6-5 TaxID=2876623 RepID=UPI001CCE95F7|nr:polyketide synthase [Mesorhizobium sp. ESP6-5]MBZ9758282.1 hypothetical protein [Mesorhizobium sp. ESP6-5]